MPDIKKYKRIIRQIFNKKGVSGIKRFGINRFVNLVAAVAVLLFFVTQLITNAILSPLGYKLQSLNTEKNLLLEKNRELEQQIAKNTSLTVIQLYSGKKFDLNEGGDKSTVFVSNTTVQALKPSN